MFKDAYGGYIVLYSYSAQDENDLSVERGQCVTVLNKVKYIKMSPCRRFATYIKTFYM